MTEVFVRVNRRDFVRAFEVRVEDSGVDVEVFVHLMVTFAKKVYVFLVNEEVLFIDEIDTSLNF